jgi:hypothetical protein
VQEEQQQQQQQRQDAEQQQQQQQPSSPVTLPVFASKEEMRAFSRQQRRAGKRLAFVPTMVRVGGWGAGGSLLLATVRAGWAWRTSARLTTHPVGHDCTLCCSQGYLHAGHMALVEEAK